MKNLYSRAALGALSLVLSMFAAGAAQAQISAAAAEKLMRLSGQWAQLDSLAQHIKTAVLKGLGEGEQPLPADVQQRVRAAADGAFDTARMRSAAQQVLMQNVRASYMPELLSWYETPQAQRITKAEEDDTAAEQLDMQARTQAGVALLQAATPERQRLLARVVEVTRSGQASADTVINMGVMLPMSIARFVPGGPQPVEAELRAALEAQRATLAQAFEGITLAGFAIVYKGLADEDVAAYVRFMSTSAGEHYTDIGEKAMEAAMASVFANLKP